MIVLRHYKDII